jgi:hypothetical protein
MKRLACLLAAACCLFAMPLGAQGSIEIDESPVIREMMNRFAEINQRKTTVEGWRIQILATTDRQRMERELQQFRILYPNTRVDWVHNSPYYKIRAGAFRTKQEALRIQYLLRKDYPGSFPAVDQTIQPFELLN